MHRVHAQMFHDILCNRCMDIIMKSFDLSKREARLFILRKQGLIGSYKFIGKQGVLEYVRQAGCIQYDPIDVCGKNSELVLQSRIKGFTKDMLYELLYEDRKLIDYFDKNLAIMPVEDWIYFERIRERYKKSVRGQEQVDNVAEEIKSLISKKGALCSKDIDFDEKVDWYWSDTKLSRAALETLYFRGDLIVHHKKGTIKYYALAKDYISKDILEAEEPFPDETEHLKWRVLRRISAVGLLWNRPSDAWLNIANMKAEQRKLVFDQLIKENKICSINIEGLKDTFYCLPEDESIIHEIKSCTEFDKRVEFIAPLDGMLWDRRLIIELFNFQYKWEIYTPESKREYGYYVLPVLYGDSFIARSEMVCDRKNKTLVVKNIWFEDGVKINKTLKNELKKSYNRFMNFHQLDSIKFENNTDV